MVRGRFRRGATLLAVLTLAACQSAREAPQSAPSSSIATSATSAPMVNRAGPLFYSKAGALYVSDPAGRPGRKLTDGSTDTQPAPSPDLAHVAFVRKADPGDYGGELWVLDLSPELEPVGPPRRLVDQAALPHGGDEGPSEIGSPRWSPTGQQVAFIDNTNAGIEDGGRLLVAAADYGALVPTRDPVLAASDFVWSPDGRHIVWVNARTDVRPVDVNVLEVGGSSTPVAKDTNTSSVTYADDGKSILFTTGDATGPDFTSIPFAIRTGGIYSIPADKPGALPAVVFTIEGTNFDDIAALGSGAVAFTTADAQDPSKKIQVLEETDYMPAKVASDVDATAQGPAWSSRHLVAYLDAPGEKALMVTDTDNKTSQRIDDGVDAFAWAP